MSMFFEETVRETNTNGSELGSDHDEQSTGELDKSIILSEGDTSSGNGDTFAKEMEYQRGSKQVLCLKLNVLFVILFAAGIVSGVIWWIAIEAEKKEFEVAFDGSAKKLLDTFHDIASHRLGALSSLSVAGMAHSLDHFKGWPYMTLTWFQHRSSTTRSLAGALFVSMHPLVSHDEREKWENYSMYNEDAAWHEQGMLYQQELGYDQYGLSFNLSSVKQRTTKEDELDVSTGIANRIFTLDEDGVAVIDRSNGPFLPTWQTSPVFGRTLVNRNLLQDPEGATPAALSLETSSVVFGGMEFAPPEGHVNATAETALYTVLLSIFREEYFPYGGGPLARVYVPLFDSFEKDKKSTALIVALIRWETYFRGILTENIRGIHLVLENTCGDTYTYVVTGDEPHPVGPGDLHDKKYDYLERSASFADVDTVEDGSPTGLPLDKDHCLYTLRAYPSDQLYDDIVTNKPFVETVMVCAVFVFTTLMFLVYDRLVERRQELVLTRAERTGAIVSSLYPKAVRDRILKGEENDKKRTWTSKKRGRNHRQDMDSVEEKQKDEIIADLFPHTSIFFADIAGFTAWSSTREPAQVFELLEGLYNSFDVLSRRRRVFKVETVGDCYVAATGVPQPQTKHAIIMAQFATDCLVKMNEVTRSLETSLGPDTGDLKLRIGIHSGPVTAGVLRGEKGRFQLFGDTVNTAARMESTGVPNRIQVSAETAELLKEGGKAEWVIPRNDSVHAKGKGVLQTYWLNVTTGSSSVSSDRSQIDVASTSTPHSSSHNTVYGQHQLARRPSLFFDSSMSAREAIEVKRCRMVEWMTELLLEHLQHILAKRKSTARTSDKLLGSWMTGGSHDKNNTATTTKKDSFIPLDEVVEAVVLPDFDAKATQADWRSITVEQAVVDELHLYVDTLSKTYRRNPFHNFEHACHVTQNVSKFLKRIVSTTVDQVGLLPTTMKKSPSAAMQREQSPRIFWKSNKSNHDDSQEEEDISSTRLLHDYTHGITSDPLTLFAIIFSALIHDADHRGISNGQLEKEMPDLAKRFKHKSLAEQNSLDIAWTIFMSHRFNHLRQCLFVSQEECDRFRQIIVNVVMATDIFDKQVNDLRKERWKAAFSSTTTSTSTSTPSKQSLQATIVLEHIIQASDVCHTMQHWHVYRRWNQRLFNEISVAHRMGRVMSPGDSNDPSTFWYEGELKFLDGYVIPLAKKLQECRVFGVNSDECLIYALRNRAEWAARGKEEVAKMTQEFQLSYIAPMEQHDEDASENEDDDPMDTFQDDN